MSQKMVPKCHASSVCTSRVRQHVTVSVLRVSQKSKNLEINQNYNGYCWFNIKTNNLVKKSVIVNKCKTLGHSK